MFSSDFGVKSGICQCKWVNTSDDMEAIEVFTQLVILTLNVSFIFGIPMDSHNPCEITTFLRLCL